MLSLKNVRKKYSHQWILRGINLHFGKTGFISILGASGSGKSTLLNLIGGLDSVSEGNIYYKEKDITKYKEKELTAYLSDNISFIFQQYNLINSMTALENLALVANKKDALKILKKLNIDYLANKKVNLLSGGEAQRIAIARAIISNTDIILCDEPTGALDLKNSEEILKILKDLSKKKLIIVVTHNEEQAKKYSDRIIKILDGEVFSDTGEVLKKINNKKTKYNKNHKKKISNIIKTNILSNIKRNILTIISFSIGLIALLMVLGIKNGFPVSLEKNELENFANYPIYISKYSKDLDQEIKSLFSKENKTSKNNEIRVYEDMHENVIDRKYINYLKEASKYISYQENVYYIHNKTIRTFTLSKEFKNSINILSGRLAIKRNEVILMVSNNSVNSNVLKEIGLKKEKFTYENIVGYKYKINNKEYEIVGIIEGKEDSVYYELTSLLYKNDNFSKQIPDEIYLYPKNYNNKVLLKKYLSKYTNVYYTDYASSIKNISITFMDGLSIILIAFSVISLIVATIMIGVLNYISVIERIKDIGIYKSLGYKMSLIKKMFIYENLIIVCTSCFFSVIIVCFLSIFINNLIFNFTGLSNVLALDIKSIIYSILLSSILSIVGSYFPLKEIRKWSITKILKYE